MHKCCDPRCSIESRNKWSRRERLCLSHRLRLARKDGYFVRCCNVGLGKITDPKTITNIIKTFNRSLNEQKIIWRYIVEGEPTLHIHAVLISQTEMDKNKIRKLWVEAMGKHYADADFYFAPLRGINAYAKYISGDTAEKRSRKLFSHTFKLRLSGGSKGFYNGGLAKLNIKLSRDAAAFGLACHDPHVHRRNWQHYLDEAHRIYSERVTSEMESELGEIVGSILSDEEMLLMTRNHCKLPANVDRGTRRLTIYNKSRKKVEENLDVLMKKSTVCIQSITAPIPVEATNGEATSEADGRDNDTHPYQTPVRLQTTPVTRNDTHPYAPPNLSEGELRRWTTMAITHPRGTTQI